MAITVPIISTWEPKGLERSIRDIQKAEGGWAKTGAAMKALQGPALIAGGAVAGIAAVSVKAAGDLGETFNAVEKTFGDSSKVITDFGKTAAQTTGLSTRAFQQLATETGAVFTNVGYSQKEAADSTIALAQRAADMASVFNTDVSTALEAINSGLKGSGEPLTKFGVNLSDASLRAYAMNKNIDVGTGTLDAQTKALLAEGLILEQTSKYAGDFADTSESMANAGRTLEGELENLSAELGGVLLPYVEDGIQLLRRFAGWAADNKGKLQALAGTIAVLSGFVIAVNTAMKLWRATTLLTTAAMKLLTSAMVQQAVAFLVQLARTIAQTAASWALAAATIAATWPVLAIVAAIALLVGGLVLAYKRSETFRRIVDSAFAAVKKIAVGAMDAISGAIRKAVDWLQRMWDKVKSVKDALSGGFGKIGDAIFGRSVAGVGPVLALGTTSTRSGARTGGGGTVNINITATDSWDVARKVKRALEGYDVRMGRAPGAALANSW